MVVTAINLDMLFVFGLKALHHLLYVGHTLLAIAHRQSGEVCVGTRTVPVGEKLRSEGNIHLIVFSDTLQKIATHHHVITDLNTNTGSHLVLPLSRHDLSVSASNLNTSVKASFVVHVSDDTAKVLVASDRTVVGALGTWVAI